jgi:hypothetical protein
MDIYLLKGTFLKNCRLFSDKGALPPERGHFLCPLKTWGLGPLGPPGPYGPDWDRTSLIE